MSWSTSVSTELILTSIVTPYKSIIPLKESSIPIIRHNGRIPKGFTSVATIDITIATQSLLRVQIRPERTTTTTSEPRLRSDRRNLSNTVRSTAIATSDTDTTFQIDHRSVTTIVQFLMQFMIPITIIVRLIGLSTRNGISTRTCLTAITCGFTKLIETPTLNTGEPIPTILRVTITFRTWSAKDTQILTRKIQSGINTKGTSNLPRKTRILLTSPDITSRTIQQVIRGNEITRESCALSLE